MNATPRRIVVCEEPTREHDLRPGQPKIPSTRFEEIARRFGDALDLPYVAVGLSLEQCELTDFVFYCGFWDAFSLATPDWPAERRSLRAHRTAHILGVPYNTNRDLVERAQFACSIPFISLGKHTDDASCELYARREIAAAAGLHTFEVFGTEHYVSALSPPGVPQEEMVARYLRTYWDKLGY